MKYIIIYVGLHMSCADFELDETMLCLFIQTNFMYILQKNHFQKENYKLKNILWGKFFVAMFYRAILISFLSLNTAYILCDVFVAINTNMLVTIQ